MNNQVFKQTLVDVFHDDKLPVRTQWVIVSAVLTVSLVACVALLA